MPIVDMDALRRLANRATQGPWKYLRGKIDLPGLRDGCAEVQTESDATVYGFKGIALLKPLDEVNVCMTQGKAEVEWANAAFIAACDPQTIIALITALESMQADFVSMLQELRDDLGYALDEGIVDKECDALLWKANMNAFLRINEWMRCVKGKPTS